MTGTEHIKPTDAAHREDHQQVSTQTNAFLTVLAISCAVAFCMAISYHRSLDVDTEVLVDGTINPNTAVLASLVRLPGIGPAKAAAIVKYRNDVEAGNVAFKNCSDMENIKGIGPKTAEKIEPWLYFKNERGIE